MYKSIGILDKDYTSWMKELVNFPQVVENFRKVESAMPSIREIEVHIRQEDQQKANDMMNFENIFSFSLPCNIFSLTLRNQQNNQLITMNGIRTGNI